jgi:hypothetical protein
MNERSSSKTKRATHSIKPSKETRAKAASFTKPKGFPSASTDKVGVNGSLFHFIIGGLFSAHGF